MAMIGGSTIHPIGESGGITRPDYCWMLWSKRPGRFRQHFRVLRIRIQTQIPKQIGWLVHIVLLILMRQISSDGAHVIGATNIKGEQKISRKP